MSTYSDMYYMLDSVHHCFFLLWFWTGRLDARSNCSQCHLAALCKDIWTHKRVGVWLGKRGRSGNTFSLYKLVQGQFYVRFSDDELTQNRHDI